MTNLNFFDHYSFRARLQPALFSLLPLALGVFAWTQPNIGWPSAIWTLLGTAGVTFFLATVARNRGKELEPNLWASWGGPPTTQLLRHRGTANTVLRARWHKQLTKVLGKAMPTPDEELANPAGADEVYAAVTRLLIDKRRDVKADPLIYKENVNYGFCRNLYAMKPIGIFCATIGIVVSGWAGLRFSTAAKPQIVPWACAAISVGTLLGWTAVVRSTWVRMTAFAYAERLLESTEKTARPKNA